MISGEQFQLLADVYIGYYEDFNQNPFMEQHKDKFVHFNDLNTITKDGKMYENKKKIFCYGDRINELSNYVKNFMNPFILITHNSDFNVYDNKESNVIANCPNLIRWYCQNLNFNHEKVYILPIGLANRMWSHGKLDIFENLKKVKKTNNVYMQFNLSTNYSKRYPCQQKLIEKGVPFLSYMEPKSNIIRLQSYEFCICPEGNGSDTHRLWEAYYTNTVPILLRSKYSELIKTTFNLPIVLLDSWDQFDKELLPKYDTFNFEKNDSLYIKNYHLL